MYRKIYQILEETGKVKKQRSPSGGRFRRTGIVLYSAPALLFLVVPFLLYCNLENGFYNTTISDFKQVSPLRIVSMHNLSLIHI